MLRLQKFLLNTETQVLGIELRSYVFLDSLQPQHAYLGTVALGFTIAVIRPYGLKSHRA